MKKADEAKLNVSMEVIRNLKPGTRFSSSLSGSYPASDRQDREPLSASEALCYEAALKIVADYLKS